MFNTKTIPGFTLSKAFLSELIQKIILTLGAFTTILILVQFIRLLPIVTGRSVPLLLGIKTLLISIPPFLEFAIPLSILIGTLLTFSRLSSNSELVALKAAGISLWTLVLMTLMVGIIFTCGCLFLSLTIKPQAIRSVNLLLNEISSSKTVAALESGSFLTLGNMVIYAEAVNHASGDLEGVIIDDKRAELSRKIFFAKNGWIGNTKTGETIIRLNKGEIQEESIKDFSVTRFDINEILVSEAGMQKNGISLTFQGMTNDELFESSIIYKDYITRIQQGRTEDVPLVGPFGQKIAEQQKNQKEFTKRVNRSEIELWKRITLPFSCITFCLMGLALGIHTARGDKGRVVTISIITGVICFMFFFIAVSISGSIIESGYTKAWYCQWIPNLIFLLMALHFVNKLAKEKNSSLINIS